MSERIELDKIYTPPVGDLGIIGMRGCEELTEKVNNYLYEGRIHMILNTMEIIIISDALSLKKTAMMTATITG